VVSGFLTGKLVSSCEG